MSMSIIKKKQISRGFTLIELVLVVALMGIISVVLGRVLMQGYKTFITSQEILETDSKAWLALERISDDIRQIRSASDISVTQTSAMTFVDVTGTTIQYSLSSDSLLRNGQTLINGVQSLTFDYLTKAGGVPANSSLVRYISISLAVTQGSLTQSLITTSATRGFP